MKLIILACLTALAVADTTVTLHMDDACSDAGQTVTIGEECYVFPDNIKSVGTSSDPADQGKYIHIYGDNNCAPMFGDTTPLGYGECAAQDTGLFSADFPSGQ